jgi:hypothetical protein
VYSTKVPDFRNLIRMHPVELAQAAKYKLGLDRKAPLIKWIEHHKPKRILEIGVFNGHFASRMLVAANKNSSDVEYVGIDLFQELQTQENYISEASLWPDSREKVLNLLERSFRTTSIELIQDYSNNALKSLNGSKFDLIFIDGGHSYETVKTDWELSKNLVSKSGVVFFDDYVNRNGTLSGFGVNEVIDQIDGVEYEVTILKRKDFFRHSFGWLTTRIVKVSTRIVTTE